VYIYASNPAEIIHKGAFPLHPIRREIPFLNARPVSVGKTCCFLLLFLRFKERKQEELNNNVKTARIAPNPLFIGLFMGFLLVPRTGLEPVTLRFEI